MKPKTIGRNNKPLPSAREVSIEVLSGRNPKKSPKSPRFSLTLVHFAQFVDHDIIFTPAFNDVKDCQENCFNPK